MHIPVTLKIRWRLSDDYGGAFKQPGPKNVFIYFKDMQVCIDTCRCIMMYPRICISDLIQSGHIKGLVFIPKPGQTYSHVVAVSTKRII